MGLLFAGTDSGPSPATYADVFTDVEAALGVSLAVSCMPPSSGKIGTADFLGQLHVCFSEPGGRR